MMIRRDFFKNSLVIAGSALSLGRAADAFPAEEPSRSTGLTRHISEFIVNTKYEDIPEDALTLGKKSMLDGFGLALAGSVSDMGPLIRQYLKTLGFVGGNASVIGTSMKVPAGFAALANGVSIHAHDYDDAGGSGHPTVTVLPPAFALSEVGRRTGRDFMLAYHTGVEVECRLAAASSERNDAFHSTSTFGSFGSAAACAKLRGLNPVQTAYALGIVSTQAAGLRANFGSMTKPLQVGHASGNGVAAADLASIGWTAADDILEDPLGFFKAAGERFNPEAIMNRLGRPWIVASGFEIKRFPCGAIQQPVMDEVLRLATQKNIQARDVERVEVGGNAGNVTTLFRHHPTTGLEGKFSMEFAVSILLLDRKAGLSQFSDAVVQRPDVQDMIRRVTFSVDPDFNKDGNFALKFTMKDGAVLSTRTGPAKGSPKNPMTYDEVADKLRGCAEFAKWPTQKVEQVIELVKSLERAPDVSRLASALTA